MESNISFLQTLKIACKSGSIPEKYCHILEQFHSSYLEKVKASEEIEKLFLQLLNLIIDQIKTPYEFQLYNAKIETPFNYYKFSLDFLRPLIEPGSKAFGKENISFINTQLDAKENVILFANHQVEPEPHAISLLLEKKWSDLAAKIIYVAGERVIVDPLARVFSMGCNLLRIFSKKYINTPIEKKSEKLLHNKKTMEKMSSLLKEGGKIIYVAPSGGRDRPNKETHKVEVAPFDPQSIEMLCLMAKKSRVITHFYPLSLSTYTLMPPPDTTQIEFGEKRITLKGKIFAYFGNEIDMNKFDQIQNKNLRKKEKCAHIQNIVIENYNKIKDL